MCGSMSEDENADWIGERKKEKHRRKARGWLVTEDGNEWGALGGEPSLLNVNVRHLLLCLYDPTAVCLYLRYARVPRSRRCKEEIEEAEKGQARRSAVRHGFCPCFWCASLFFCPLYFAPPRVRAPRKPRRLGTRSFVKFYDGPRCALYPLYCMHYGPCAAVLFYEFRFNYWLIRPAYPSARTHDRTRMRKRKRGSSKRLCTSI